MGLISSWDLQCLSCPSHTISIVNLNVQRFEGEFITKVCFWFKLPILIWLQYQYLIFSSAQTALRTLLVVCLPIRLSVHPSSCYTFFIMFNQNSYVLIQDDAFQNVIWKMTAILTGLNVLMPYLYSTLLLVLIKITDLYHHHMTNLIFCWIH